MLNNLPEIQYLMYSGDFDILCTETWLTNNITDGLIDLRANYRVIRRDRPNSRWDGVCILLSRYLDVIEIPIINYFPSLEIIFIDIYDGASRFRLFNVYRRKYYGALCIDYTWIN